MQLELALFGLETSNLSFRKFEENDIADWLEFCEDESYWKFFNMTHEKTYEQHAQDWLENVNNRYNNNLGMPNAIIHKASGRLAGIGGLLLQNIKEKQYLEVSYSFMPWARGKGWAIEAAKRFRDFAFQHDLAQEVISTIHIENYPSQKVAIKNAMTIKFETIYKNLPVYIYSIDKTKWLEIQT